jgi:hypothetical protein
MMTKTTALMALLLPVLLVFVGCDESNDESGLALDANGCPIERLVIVDPSDGPKCSTDGLRCEYWYTTEDCGGEAYICMDGVWTMVLHWDPSEECYDAGSDGG